MVPATSNKGLFYWQQDGDTAFVALATDDILLATTNKKFYIKIQHTFDNYFAYTTKEGSILQFLNYRIIQSDYGTSVDQYNHIRQTMLQVFFPHQTVVLFQSSPFPLDVSIEMSLFQASPMSEKEMQLMTEQYHGSYNHWVGALLHMVDKSRWDLSYTSMRLS